jgi:hypothetical protein
MAKLRDGHTEALHFRTADHFQELAQSYNEMADGATTGNELLAEFWGGVFWSAKTPTSSSVLEEWGQAIRHAIQVSTMQGQSCLDRLEALQREAAIEARASVKRELALLPGRALRPLFLLVMPSVLALLITAFLMEWFESGFI